MQWLTTLKGNCSAVCVTAVSGCRRSMWKLGRRGEACAQQTAGTRTYKADKLSINTKKKPNDCVLFYSVFLYLSFIITILMFHLFVISAFANGGPSLHGNKIYSVQLWILRWLNLLSRYQRKGAEKRLLQAVIMSSPAVSPLIILPLSLRFQHFSLSPSLPPQSSASLFVAHGLLGTHNCQETCGLPGALYTAVPLAVNLTQF